MQAEEAGDVGSIPELGSAREFSSSPVVRALHFHCRGRRFCPWLGNFKKKKERNQ